MIAGCLVALLVAGNLIDAVKASDRAAIRTLLQQRADVNATEPDGNGSPLGGANE